MYPAFRSDIRKKQGKEALSRGMSLSSSKALWGERSHEWRTLLASQYVIKTDSSLHCGLAKMARANRVFTDTTFYLTAKGLMIENSNNTQIEGGELEPSL